MGGGTNDEGLAGPFSTVYDEPKWKKETRPNETGGVLHRPARLTL